MTKLNVQKLQEFKGKIATKFVSPTNYKRWAAGANKLLKFWFRIERDKLYWPDIVQTLKVAAGVWIVVAEEKFADDERKEDLVTELGKIQQFNLVSTAASEVVIESIRLHQNQFKCGLCCVPLVYPAYVVKRQLGQELYRSQPMGIRCLHSRHGNLIKMLTGEQMRKIIDEVDVYSKLDPALADSLRKMFGILDSTPVTTAVTA